MILDERTEFASSVSVAASAGTALIGDVIDLEATGIDVGLAADLWFVIIVTTSIITGGSAGTVKFQLASDAQAAIATDGSATVHFDTGTFVTDDDALNDLDAGDVVCAIKLPNGAPGGRTYERYLGVLCVTATTTTTAGAIDAFLTPNLGAAITKRHYPEGMN